MVIQEGIEMEEVEPVIFNVAVKVYVEGGEATLQLPAEVTPTERLVSYLHKILKARGLEIKHWTLDEVQQKNLEKLSNVIVEDTSGEKN